jgi:hypothetical protein
VAAIELIKNLRLFMLRRVPSFLWRRNGKEQFILCANSQRFYIVRIPEKAFSGRDLVSAVPAGLILFLEASTTVVLGYFQAVPAGLDENGHTKEVTAT